MKHTIVALLLVVCMDASAQKAEERAVKSSFSNYRKAILESNGAEAVKWVDSKTVAYYGQMLETALTADSAEVARLGLMDKFTVFTVRHKIPKADIAALDGRQFFIYSIDKGMVGKNTVANIDLGNVKVEGTFANGQIVANGEKSPLFFQFNKEDGQWRLDITSLFPATNAGLKRAIGDQGMTEDEFIFQALEAASGKAVSNAIWLPMN